MLQNLVYIALGGALGSVLRWLSVQVVAARFGMVFPYGTMAVNIVGSALMGVLVGWLARATPQHQQELQLFLAVGVLGGFTTFSAFSLDVVRLLEQGAYAPAIGYAVSSVLLSVAALVFGMWLVRLV